MHFPQKTGENAETQICLTKCFENFRKCPNASERIQMHLNASKRIQMHPNASKRTRMHPNRSEQVRKLQKTCENLEKNAKNSRKCSRTLVFEMARRRRTPEPAKRYSWRRQIATYLAVPIRFWKFPEIGTLPKKLQNVKNHESQTYTETLPEAKTCQIPLRHSDL